MTIRRFSSLRERLDHSFLASKLANATSYKRIAGYFRSSILELVGEEIAGIGTVRIVCNSELDPRDINIAKSVRDAKMLDHWNEIPPGMEALLDREKYKRLYELLTKGSVQIRVVSKEKVFLHGKAGVIETPTGKIAFLGSVNETRSAFADNYEILWEDSSPEGVAWVEAEFEALWSQGVELPQCIVTEVKRMASRIEISVPDSIPEEVPAGALVESPLYRNGNQLQPWQRSFVSLFLEHREHYGKARLLLADEVGLGKTLSLAACALASALLNDGPVLILCPSTLTFQWQTELDDKLGIPSAVWSSNRKVWLDQKGHTIRTQGAIDITRCPCQIALVSTGLIFHDTEERRFLLERKYGMIIVDEAHKARQRGGLGENKDSPNNLLDFLLKIAPRTRHMLLGTATPIQTEVRELWDLLQLLHMGADFVLGRGAVGPWRTLEQAIPYVKGASEPQDTKHAWELIRNPLPPANEHQLVAVLRQQLDLPDDMQMCDKGFSSLPYAAKLTLDEMLADGFFRSVNPVVRHTVLRKRSTLEEQGLIEKVKVEVHPDSAAHPGTYAGPVFIGHGLQTNTPFELAYRAAEEFSRLLRARSKSAGFMRSMLLQRICSSFASGLSTATKMLRREVFEDEEDIKQLEKALEGLLPSEAVELQKIVTELSRPEAVDPKLAAVEYFLTEHTSEGKTWAELGCILFSQYYDTALWVARRLAEELKGTVVAVYAGSGKSGVFRDGEFVSVEREEIKAAVKNRKIQILVATDAACEGLNLQTLGTLINIDLPWNPSRLEQRLGRIKRFGQARSVVDMLNLVYHDTRDEVVYSSLSRRMKDKFDIFGSLPDTIEDDWIESEEELEKQMDQYIHLRSNAKDIFELKYQSTIDPDQNKWEECSKVFARRDVIQQLSEPW